jgi:DnaK suppressor protein
MSGTRKKVENIKKKKKAPGKPAKVIPVKKMAPVKKEKVKKAKIKPEKTKHVKPVPSKPKLVKPKPVRIKPSKPKLVKPKPVRIKPVKAKPEKTNKKEVTPKGRTDFRSSFLENLEGKRKEIKETLDRLLNSRKEYSGELTAGDFIDEIDDAQREISAYSQYSLIERKIRELQKIEHLINRISKKEEFGLCEECGNPIPRERLIIVPEASLCVACQRELEKLDHKKSLAARGPSTFGSRKDMDWEGSSPPDEDDGMLIEYHIGSLPAVEIDEADIENPPEEKNEK